MRFHTTFAAYVTRQFLFWWFGMFFVLVILIALFDTAELMRRTSGSDSTTIFDVLAMTAFKLPHLAQKAIPFTVLFGGMMAFWRLNRHHELVVARAAGVSAWEFLAPVLLIAIVMGVIKITVYSPFASAMMFRYDQLETQHIRGKQSLAALADKGLWLRQQTGAGHYILHADSIEPNAIELDRVIVFQFNLKDQFTSRIDARKASLEKGRWRLMDVRIAAPEHPVAPAPVLYIQTDLTQENIQDSFAKPETMSFWALPAFISILENAGFSGLRHRLYWYSQIADPALLCAMVLFAAIFTLRPQRRGGTSATIGLGVITGFVVYFTTDVAYALGLSARLPAILAAWSPATVSLLLGAGWLFHMEDG
jgi:lipopolysaccharide export system permease protein